LFNYGGHIGYGVRPEFRRRGYATEILRQSLGYIRELGVADVLMTCLDENVGSATVIETCGGELENIVDLEGKPLRRYWIREG
jgi:predicted acetyltransferase